MELETTTKEFGTKDAELRRADLAPASTDTVTHGKHLEERIL